MYGKVNSIPGSAIFRLFICVLFSGMILSGCNKVQDEIENTANQPSLAATASTALQAHWVSFIGSGALTAQAEKRSSSDITYWSNIPNFMQQSIQNGGSYWLVPVSPSVSPDGVLMIYKVRPAFASLYDNADFVIAATVQTGAYNPQIGVKSFPTATCDLTACVTIQSLTKTYENPAAYTCAQVNCSNSGGNQGRIECYYKQCHNGDCNTSFKYVLRAADCKNLCSSDSQCGGEGEVKTCLMSSCESSGGVSKFQNIYIELGMNKSCPLSNGCDSQIACQQGCGSGQSLLDRVY